MAEEKDTPNAVEMGTAALRDTLEAAALSVSHDTPADGTPVLRISPRNEVAGGVVPEAILKDAMKRHNSSLISDIAAERTLTGMARAYIRGARAMEASFSVMYKERESSAPADIDERERVIKDIHKEREDARNFLHDIRDSMQVCDLLSRSQNDEFNSMLALHRRR